MAGRFKRTKGFRVDILPGCGVWDSFFDTGVQAVLERRHLILKPDLPEQHSRRLLAWPIRAFEMVDDMATTDRPERQDDFLRFSLHQPAFLADLLAAVTKYHQTPETEWSLTRKLAAISAELVGDEPPLPTASNGRPMSQLEIDEYFKDGWLMSWQEVCRHFKGAKRSRARRVAWEHVCAYFKGPTFSDGRLMSWPEISQYMAATKEGIYSADRLRAKDFYLERKRRRGLLKHWQPHFEAWRSLEKSRAVEHYLPTF